MSSIEFSTYWYGSAYNCDLVEWAAVMCASSRDWRTAI